MRTGSAFTNSHNVEGSTNGDLWANQNGTYGDDTNYVPTTSLLPRLNSRNTGQHKAAKTSYGTASSSQINPDSGQVSGADSIPYVAINGDGRNLEPESSTDRRPFILITLMVMLTVCAVRLQTAIMSQYLYMIYAKAVFGNVSVDTSSQPCVNSSGIVSISPSQTDLVNSVQEQATGMSLYLDLTSYGIGMFSNLLLGTMSSVMSRKMLLLIPTTGYLVRCVVTLVIVCWNLDIYWWFLGYSIDGICGNTCGILLGTFLYTSDVTPRTSKRTMGVAIVETVKGIVGAAFYIVSGQLIEKTGFIIPSSASAGIQLMAVFVICIMPNRKPELSEAQRQQVKSVKGALLHMVSPFHASKDRRVKWMIGLASAGFFIAVAVRVGLDNVQNLYVMNLPFCFDAITIGWFLFARDLIQHLFTIFAMILLFRFMPGMLLGIVGALCMVAYCCVYAFAKFDWEVLYVVTAIGLAQNLPFCIIRGEASRLLGSYYQGPLFACVAVLESIAYASGSPIFLSVYKWALHFFAGLVYLLGAGFVFIAFVIMWENDRFDEHVAAIRILLIEKHCLFELFQSDPSTSSKKT